MSEDADIKVVVSPDTVNWSKTQLRRYLGDEVRGQVVKALEGCGLAEIVDSRRSLNDNQYIQSQWAYKRAYDGIAALRLPIMHGLYVQDLFIAREHVELIRKKIEEISIKDV
jgi:hypothetical protein